MVLQQLCKPATMPFELYFRGKALAEEDGISIEDGTVTFDTYFNLFSLGVWKAYAKINALSVSVNVSGSGRIALMGFERDPQSAREIISKTYDCHTPETILLLDHEIESLADHLYIKVSGKKTKVYEALYATDLTPAPVRIACCFCTYRREKEIIQNVRRLYDDIINDPASPLHGHMEVFIADNGQTLSEDQIGKLQGVHLFKNRNYGGSAGFTRCMIEAALKRRGFTHLILMDDDAHIEPYVVERTAALLGALREEHRGKMIGGAMLCLEQPTLQIENGAWIDPKNWRIALPGKNRELSGIKDVIANEEKAKVNYNGWFYCCIPTGFINENNLPLPMFLHADDQEYGLRNKSGIIRMNGICIWHPNPWARKRAYIEYYDARNAMIALSKTNPKLSIIYICIKETYSILRHLASYKYEEALYRIRGYHDFYNGPEWYKQQDAEKLNREIMGLYKTPTCDLSQEIIKSDLDEPQHEDSDKKLKKMLNYFVPAYKGRKIFDDNLPWECVDPFAVKQLCIINVKTGKGIQLTKSYRKMFKILRDLIGLLFLIIRKHRNISKMWSNADLQSMKFWTSYLQLKG